MNCIITGTFRTKLAINNLSLLLGASVIGGMTSLLLGASVIVMTSLLLGASVIGGMTVDKYKTKENVSLFTCKYSK